MFPFGGVVSVRVLAPEHGGCGEGPQRPTSLCSMSSAWVVEPGRINTADEIADALVNETVNVGDQDLAVKKRRSRKVFPWPQKIRTTSQCSVPRIEDIRRLQRVGAAKATRQQDSAVGEQGRGRMVEAGIRGRAGGADGVRDGIVEVGALAGLTWALVIGRPALGEHPAVRQQDRVHLDPA